jgi:1,2-phenylacetyl-CoA epoxidase PaaB subunit
MAQLFVWDVLGKRTQDGELEVVGSIKAPDLDLALLLAKETHFRHKEGVAYAVRRRGDEEVHAGHYDAELLGGLTDRSYRRQDGYTGVGAKLKRIHEEMAARGLVIDRPRPKPGRVPPVVREDARARAAAGEPPDIRDIPPEEIAAHGTAG